jgi:hypothetical protein
MYSLFHFPLGEAELTIIWQPPTDDAHIVHSSELNARVGHSEVCISSSINFI